MAAGNQVKYNPYGKSAIIYLINTIYKSAITFARLLKYNNLQIPQIILVQFRLFYIPSLRLSLACHSPAFLYPIHSMIKGLKVEMSIATMVTREHKYCCPSILEFGGYIKHQFTKQYQTIIIRGQAQYKSAKAKMRGLVSFCSREI